MYVVLTRRYLKNGDCIKRRACFKTRAAQSRYVDRLGYSVCVTYSN